MADREKVIRDCNWAINQITVNGFTTVMTKGFFKDVITLLKNQPEIVRCKDCIYRGSNKCIVQKYLDEHPKTIWFLSMQNEWFCADGRRKDD